MIFRGTEIRTWLRKSFSDLIGRWTLAQAHRGADGKIMVFKGAGADPVEEDNPLIASITFIIDGGGSAITAPEEKGHLEIPFACTIQAWTLLADQAGAIKIDVWRKAYADFPPANADSLCGGHEPEIVATNQKAQDTDLGDWTSVALVAGDILAFNVDSCTTIERVTISLKVSKS